MSDSIRQRQRQVMAYSACAVAALAGVQPAEGAIVHVTGMSFTVTNGDGLVNWDVDGNASNDFQLSAPTVVPVIFANMPSVGGGGRFVFDGGNNVQELATTFVVQQTLAMYAFQTTGDALTLRPHAAAFMSSTSPFGMTGYAGFQFMIGGNTHYGWANLTATSGDITFNDWAYDNLADESIQVGATMSPIPEPSSLALLSMGAAGLMRFRRRRGDAEDEDPADPETA